MNIVVGVLAAVAALALLWVVGQVWELAGGWQAVRGRISGRPGSGSVSGGRVVAAVAAGMVILVATRWPVAGLFAAWLVWAALGPRAAVSGEQAEALALWVEMLRDAAGTAHGVEGLFLVTADGAPLAIRADVLWAAGRLRAARGSAAGESFEVVMRDLGERLAHPAADLVVISLLLAARSGSGELRQLLGDVALQARQEAGMQRRANVAQERAKVQMWILSGLFVALVVYFAVAVPDLASAYGTPAGQVVLAGILGAAVAVLEWRHRLSRFRSAPRFLVREGAA